MSSKKRFVSLLACLILLLGAASCNAPKNSVLSATGSPTGLQPSPSSDSGPSAASSGVSPASPSALSSGAVPGPGTEATFYVNADNLKVRSSPSTSGSILGMLSAGTKLTGTVANGWLKFTYNGQTAYCMASYLTKDTPAAASTTPTTSSIPQENNPDPDLITVSQKAYSDVLFSNIEFLSKDDNKNIYLKDFRYWNKDYVDSPLKVTRFTVIDMDGDNIPEVVLELTNGADGSIEVLHYFNGTVYGFNFVYRGLKILKTDGTFNFSSGAADSGYGKLEFLKDTCSEKVLGYSKSSHDSNLNTSISYFKNDMSVSEDEFYSFCKEQNNKEDAEWYDFSEQNIIAVLSNNPIVSASPALPSPIFADRTIIEAYKDVLTNKQEFFSNPNQVYPGEYIKAKIYLKDFNYFWDYPVQTVRFAVLDMDGDQIPEIVLESDDYRSYEVLHYDGGIVCGYNFVYRGMENLKADGTYIASGGADVNYYRKLQFLKDSYIEQALAHSDMDYDGTVSYFIGDNAVLENDFLAYCDKQDTKKDAVWYDYTPQSIEQVFK